MATSFAGQMLVAGIAVLLPLVFTDKLPQARLAFRVEAPPAAAPAAPRAPEHVQLVRVPHQVRAGILVEPHSMPVRARQIVDPPTPADLGPAQPGVVGGIGEPGGAGANTLLNGLLAASQQAIAPPPPTPAPKKHAAPTRVLQITQGGKVQEALLVHKVVPVYPPLAQQTRISGTVVLHAVIARDGHVEELQAVSGHPLLVPAALAAVRQWVYRPTTLDGVPVEVITEITVRFILGQ